VISGATSVLSDDFRAVSFELSKVMSGVQQDRPRWKRAVSTVSMIRRGSVIVSFLFGAAIFHEKNLKAKFVDLLLVLLGMLFLYFGTK
jgi:predicted metalloendopeptidase